MEQYRINSVDEITEELITALISRFKLNTVPRIKKLQNYYLGEADIKIREMNDPTKPNHKIANPFATYIVDTIQGYFLGKPVAYQSDEDELMEKIQHVLDENYEQSHNSKIGKSISICGVAYELLYMNETNEIKLAYLDPKEVFMIYDNTINMNPLASIRFYESEDYITGETTMSVELYTEDNIYMYKEGKKGLELVEEYQHYFKQVPINPYFSNDEMQGSFEKIIDLINSYDQAVSDTANNIEYFADAYLMLSGVDMEDEDVRNMKENRVILMPDDGKGEWLVKDSANIEIEEFKTRLREDIHTLSFVPSLSDESFGSASSGESLKYKLFGLENSVSNMERLFQRSLETRIRMITNIFNIKGSNCNCNDITVIFTRNLPTNMSYMADIATKLRGVISHKTLLNQLPFISDAQGELDLIQAEQADSMYSIFDEKYVDVPEEVIKDVEEVLEVEED